MTLAAALGSTLVLCVTRDSVYVEVPGVTQQLKGAMAVRGTLLALSLSDPKNNNILDILHFVGHLCSHSHREHNLCVPVF